MRLFDTHCHLIDRAYAQDIDRVLDRAWRAGLAGAICVGYDLSSSLASVSLAGRDARLWAAVGVHPHDASRVSGEDFEKRLREMARDDKVVAIGETGLDFYRDLSPRPAQREVFRRQVRLALELGLPLIVHDRDAHEETLSVLREFYSSTAGDRPRGVMHCFSGDTGMAEACLGLGFYISFAGPLTYPKAEKARSVARVVPWDRLLVETDCPYLSPQSRRGRRNEPAHVADVVVALAAVKGVPPEEAARRTSRNARTLFGLAGKDPGRVNPSPASSRGEKEP